MKEIDFLDRVPNYPGRILLNPVSGQPNTFDMERADEPLVEGTPMNKALLQSITHSRLTGRFYQLANSKSLAKTETYTTPILQALTWSVDPEGLIATSGAYQVTASSASSTSYEVKNAFDGISGTQWRSSAGTEHTVTIKFPSAIRLKKFKLQLGSSGGGSFTMKLQGSGNGASWTNLYTASNYIEDLTEYTLSATGNYQYYRFVFNWTEDGYIYINELEFSEWEVNSYQNTFTATGVTGTYDKGQRVVVQVDNIGQYAVAKNTFMGITCNTILQANKRYELTYNGSTFDAKEV